MTNGRAPWRRSGATYTHNITDNQITHEIVNHSAGEIVNEQREQQTPASSRLGRSAAVETPAAQAPAEGGAQQTAQLSFAQACIAETTTNPYAILVYGLTGDGANRVALREGSFWKWHAWLEALLYMEEERRFAQATTAAAVFQPVRLARAGYFRDHGVLVHAKLDIVAHLPELDGEGLDLLGGPSVEASR